MTTGPTMMTRAPGLVLLTPRWMQAPDSSGSPRPSNTAPCLSRPRMLVAVTLLQSMPPPCSRWPGAGWL